MSVLQPTREADGSAADNASTHSSPPHDAAAVLAALASRSPRRPSPRPPTSPKPAGAITADNLHDTSPTAQRPRRDGHARQPSETSAGGASSIRRSSSPGGAPTVVRSSRGIAFMPSASHFLSAQPTVDVGEEIMSSSPKPPMSRTASGVARDIVQGDPGKAVGRSASQRSLKSLASGHLAKTAPPEREMEDSVSEAQVDEMVKRGKIEVGVVADTPDALAPVEDTRKPLPGPKPEYDGGKGDENTSLSGSGIASTKASTLPRSKSSRSTRSIPTSPSTVPQKREANELADTNEVVSERLMLCPRGSVSLCPGRR